MIISEKVAGIDIEDICIWFTNMFCSDTYDITAIARSLNKRPKEIYFSMWKALRGQLKYPNSISINMKETTILFNTFFKWKQVYLKIQAHIQIK